MKRPSWRLFRTLLFALQSRVRRCVWVPLRGLVVASRSEAVAVVYLSLAVFATVIRERCPVIQLPHLHKRQCTFRLSPLRRMLCPATCGCSGQLQPPSPVLCVSAPSLVVRFGKPDVFQLLKTCPRRACHAKAPTSSTSAAPPAMMATTSRFTWVGDSVVDESRDRIDYLAFRNARGRLFRVGDVVAVTSDLPTGPWLAHVVGLF